MYWCFDVFIVQQIIFSQYTFHSQKHLTGKDYFSLLKEEEDSKRRINNSDFRKTQLKDVILISTRYDTKFLRVIIHIPNNLKSITLPCATDNIILEIR